MSNIEVKDGVVFKDGEEVGTYRGGNFLAGKFIHHKTAASIVKQLANMHGDGMAEIEDEPQGDEPVPGEGGDIDHKLIAHREQNWKPERFKALYPEARLKACGYRG